MSRIINTLAIAAAAGITGYFIYRIILPKLKDIQLPTWQFPDMSSFQFPPQTPQQQQPSQYGTPSIPPPPQQQDDDTGEEEEVSPSTSEAPQSTIAPPPPVGQILYDSTKGWSGVTTAASGNPKWSAGGDGVGRLSCGAGHCRVYIAVKNHNARMEGDFMFESGAVDNLSLRLRSRHQEGGACENRFGGFGASITPAGGVKFQTESCHNNHENTITGNTSAISKGQWHRFAFSTYDSADKKSVNFRLEIDGKTVLTGKHAAPKPYYMDENLHNQKSYIWLRSNNSGQGVVAFKNFRVVKIGGATTTNTQFLRFSNPYLYSSFYNRRRL